MINSKEMFDYKVGIYARESRDDNEENYETIETQRDLLLDYVKKNNLGEIKKIYIDDNVSGSGFDRIGIDMLSSDVKNGTITLLVIKDLSRLGRNNAKTLLFLDFLEEYSVRVITFDGKYDSIRDNDTVGIHTWYNEHYIRDISKKIRSNLRYKIEKGEYIGTAPFGYKKALNEKNKLVIDDSSAEIVKLIFKLYIQGYGYTYISKILNSKGFPTPSMNSNTKAPATIWNAVSVKRILFNRVYIGDTVQGISEKISFKSKKTRRLPKDKWVITKKTHTAIISIEDFEEANKVRCSKMHLNRQHKGLIHLFKGLIYCGNCGKSMYARKRSNKPMAYICSTYFKFGKGSCSSHHITEDFICGIIKGEIEKIFLLDENEMSIYKISELLNQSEIQVKMDIEKLEKALKIKQKQQEVMYFDKLEGKISEQLFYRSNLNIETRIFELRSEIEKLNIKTAGNINHQKIFNFEDVIISNNLFKFIIDKIIVFDKGDNCKDYNLNFSEEQIIARKDAVIIYFKT